MRTSTVLCACAFLFLLPPTGALAGEGHDHGKAEKTAPPPGLTLETLLKHALTGVDGTEVILSRVTIPPGTTLPKHWHPGEEFAYVLEGSVTLWQDGKENVRIEAGEAGMVPLKQIHTAMTDDDGAVLLVFRVHEQGQPERILVD